MGPSVLMLHQRVKTTRPAHLRENRRVDLERDLPWSVTGVESVGRVWLPQSLLEQDIAVALDTAGQVDERNLLAGDELLAWAERVQLRAANAHEETDRWLLDELGSVLREAMARGQRGVVAVRRESAIPLTPIREGTLAHIGLDRPDIALRDAWIDIESLILESGILRWTGHINRDRLRYPYELALSECDEYALDDEAKLGGTDIASMGLTREGFLLRGNFPVEILVSGPVSAVEVRVSALPRWRRSWWQWRPVELLAEQTGPA